jgi:hypothetical protein
VKFKFEESHAAAGVFRAATLRIEIPSDAKDFCNLNCRRSNPQILLPAKEGQGGETLQSLSKMSVMGDNVQWNLKLLDLKYYERKI